MKYLDSNQRLVVYSFLGFKILLSKIVKLDSKTREQVQVSKVLNKKKFLKIIFKDGHCHKGIEIAANIASAICFKF